MLNALRICGMLGGTVFASGCTLFLLFLLIVVVQSVDGTAGAHLTEQMIQVGGLNVLEMFSVGILSVVGGGLVLMVSYLLFEKEKRKRGLA